MGAGQARHDLRHVEFEYCAVFSLRLPRCAEHALGLHIGFDQRDLFVGPAGQSQVTQAFVVDREDTAGGAILRRHVGDRGPVGQRQVVQAVAVEFDEFADDAKLAQHLHDGQHQVGGGGPFRQLAGQFETHHLRNQHGDGLAQHGRLGLDAAHAPADHADTVDHGGVRIGAHHGVGVSHAIAAEHHPRQVLQVDLVHDAGVGRHHAEIAEGGLAPAQETVALLVALELDLVVQVERIGLPVTVHLHRVVDDQLCRRQRIDLAGSTAQRDHRVPHRGQVDHGRNAGEVLQHHAGRRERDFRVGVRGGIPAAQRFDIAARDVDAVFVAQQVLQQDFQAEGKARDIKLFC